MDEQLDDKLTESELAALRLLAAAPASEDRQAALEDRVVAALQTEGLVAARRRSSWRVGGLIAAALLLFVAGMGAQRLLLEAATPGPQAVRVDDRYLLLLLEPAAAPLAQDVEAARVQEYSEWAGGLAARGLLEAGEKLADGSVIVGTAAGGAPMPDERVTGFFIVRAADEAAALELATGSPHVRHGGRVEVRRIEPT